MGLHGGIMRIYADEAAIKALGLLSDGQEWPIEACSECNELIDPLIGKCFWHMMQGALR